MIENVTVHVDGAAFNLWKSIRISATRDEPAASISLTTAKDPRYYSEPWLNEPLIEVRSNGDLKFTGYLEDIDFSADAQSGREITLSGRSKGADLVDSSASGSFQKMNTLQIIRRLAEPYGITVEDDGGEYRTHDYYTPGTGQSVIGAIYDVLRSLPEKKISVTADGNIRIWDAENRPRQGAISIGGGIKTLSARIQGSRRFSDFTALGQDSTNFEQVQASQIGARVSVSGKRYRNKILFVGADPDDTTARSHAHRAAKKSFENTAEVTIQMLGWRDGSGDFWQPNSKVWIDIPELSQSGELLAHSVDFEQDLTGGTVANLTLRPIGFDDGLLRGVAQVAATSDTSPTPTATETPAITGGVTGLLTDQFLGKTE